MCRLALRRLECDFCLTLNYLGIRIVHIRIKRDPPVLTNYQTEYSCSSCYPEQRILRQNGKARIKQCKVGLGFRKRRSNIKRERKESKRAAGSSRDSGGSVLARYLFAVNWHLPRSVSIHTWPSWFFRDHQATGNACSFCRWLHVNCH